MIPVKDELDRTEIFSQILMVGELFAPRMLTEEKKKIRDLLSKCGVNLISADYTVLDHSHVGNSVVTIVKYSLDYEKTKRETEPGERVSLEGIVTMEHDGEGTRHIWISPRPFPFRPSFDTQNSQASVITDHGF